MSLLEIIENRFKYIRESSKIDTLQYVLELNDKKCNFSDMESKLGIRLSDGIKEIYSKYKRIKIVWEIQQTRERGYFELIPFERLYSSYKELIELSKEFVDDDRIENINSIIEDIRSWIPIIIFPNGDAFCIDKRSDKIVFYEHEVFDTGENLHGLVIAQNIDNLIKEWGKVLFIDIYDWYEGLDGNGIDVNKDIFKNIIHQVE